jgi:alpha-tubulin suppressor-like RCC1 family protein
VALLATVACSSLPAVDPGAPERACAATAGRTWCAPQCVDLAADPAHCGACGRACPGATVCADGRCTRRFVDLSSSFNHTCGVEVGGAVWCWGADESGQGGDGDQALARTRPTRAVGVTASRVFAGYAHTCARSTDGALRCWGADPHGELGDGATAAVRLEPVVARGATDTAAMALGMAFSCAADDRGAARCWGSNEWGGLGDGRSGRPQPVAPVGIAGVTALGAGWGHVCALAEFGAVWCWGSRGFAQTGDGRAVPVTAVATTPVQTLPEGIDALAVGNTVACALGGDRRVWCWGDNVLGSSGDGTTERRWAPVVVPGLEATALYGGFATFFARRADGSLVGWGKNDEGALGVAGGHQLVPVAVLGELAPRVARVVAGGSHACALLADQTVRCWGGNNLGQLGNGTTGAAVLAPSEPAW